MDTDRNSLGHGLPEGASYLSGAELARRSPVWEQMQDSSPKLFRALELSLELREQIQRAVPERWVRLVIENDGEDPEVEALVMRDSTDRRLIREWSLLLGDAIHNARTALDHTVHAVVERNSGTPGDRTSFPTAKRRRDLNHASVAGARPQVLQAVLGMEPWRNGAGHWLWVLSCIDNIDKHRMLLDLDNWWNQEITIVDLATGGTSTGWISTAGRHDGEAVRTAPRGSIRLRQASGAIWITTRDGDIWDGLSPEGYRLPALIVMQRCFDASVGAIGRLTNLA